MICQLVRSPPAVEVVFWIPGSPDVGTGEMAAKKARNGFGAASLEWGGIAKIFVGIAESAKICACRFGALAFTAAVVIIQCQVALGSKETCSCRGF